MKYLHICILDKFIPPYIDFIKDNFIINEHKFILVKKKVVHTYGLNSNHPVEWLDPNNKSSKNYLFYLMKKAKKIILHGLWHDFIIKFLYYNSIFLKKSYWVAWGGDFYFPEKHSKFKHFVIRNIGYILTYLQEDFKYIKKHYKAKATMYECLCYTSNTVDDCLEFINKNNNNRNKKIKILIGNSATESNNHFYIFEKLKKIKNKEKYIFYVPLSYGHRDYAKKVIEKGKQTLGNFFVPLLKYIEYVDYLKFLSNIDIAIFAHNRQQAMGNTIKLLAMGKKVFLRKNTSQWKLFKKLNIKIYNVESLSENELNFESLKENIEKMKKYFSLKNLKKQWRYIFEK